MSLDERLFYADHFVSKDVMHEGTALFIWRLKLFFQTLRNPFCNQFCKWDRPMRFDKLQSSKRALSRRHFVGFVGTAVVVAGCSKATPVADVGWESFAQAGQPFDHSAWDSLLAKYVRENEDGVNRVDYAGLVAGGKRDFSAYLKALQGVKLDSLTKPEQFAFWVNLYNAATLETIVERYPVKSIRELGTLGQGPWKDNRLKVSGKNLSLDDIEHKILRPIWGDVRIHYAVNCASIGCPNLATQAYTGERLEAMLDRAARAYVTHPRGFADKGGALVASSIFDWYGEDWGGVDGVLAHAREVGGGKAAPLLATATKISQYDYDWSLNDVANV